MMQEKKNNRYESLRPYFCKMLELVPEGGFGSVGINIVFHQSEISKIEFTSSAMVKSDGSAHWKVAVGSNKTSGVPLNLEFKTRAEGGKE